MSVLCFSCTEIHDRADQQLFWRGPKIFGRARSLVRFPPPIRFAPPHVTTQFLGAQGGDCIGCNFGWLRMSIRDAETTILITIAFWRGLGRGKSYGKLSRNAVFPGKFHDNKIWNFCEFYCQKCCCHLGGSKNMFQMCLDM